MSFPTIAGSNGGGTTTNATSSTINLPASIVAGELVFAAVTVDQNTGSAFTGWPTGWVELYAADASTLIRQELRYKLADGTEGASFVLGHQNNMSSHKTWKIGRGTFHYTTMPEAAVFPAPAITTTPDAPTLNPTGWAIEDTLWVWVMGYDDGTVTPTTPLGDGFALVGTAERGNNNQSTGTVVGSKVSSGAASLDPASTVTTLSVSKFTITATVAVRSFAGVPTYQLAAEMDNHQLLIELGVDAASQLTSHFRGTNATAYTVGVSLSDSGTGASWIFYPGDSGLVIDIVAQSGAPLEHPDHPSFVVLVHPLVP